jgi:type I restriction enzyme, S subunit
MIDNLKPYPKYKESSIAWIGRIPEHWTVLPNRALFDEMNERGYPNEEMLSVTIKKGVIRQKVLLEGTSKKDSSNLDRGAYKLVMPNDLVYNKMRAWQGAIGFSSNRGIVSPAYIVIRLRDMASWPLYFHYLYRTPLFSKEAERWSYGITSDMWSLRPEDFKMIYTVIPTPVEQAAIVKYLGYATDQIDKAIKAKKKIIALLEEEKQAIIQRAVTKGLDPKAKMKDSGVPWIGEIPYNWTICRAKYLLHEIDERSKDGKEELLSVSHLTGITPRSRKTVTMFKAASYSGHKLCHVGDLVVNTMWAWMGAIGISGYYGIVSPSYSVYQLFDTSTIEGEFIENLIRTKPFLSNIICHSIGLRPSRLRLYPEEFLKLQLLIPPLNEQKYIMGIVHNQTTALNMAIDKTLNDISLLREYRTRLIADVVTGKLDVREAARHLPEVGEDLVAVDSVDHDEEDEEELEEEEV